MCYVITKLGQGQQKGKDVKSKKVAEVENKEEIVEKVKELKIEETVSHKI